MSLTNCFLLLFQYCFNALIKPVLYIIFTWPIWIYLNKFLIFDWIKCTGQICLTENSHARNIIIPSILVFGKKKESETVGQWERTGKRYTTHSLNLIFYYTIHTIYIKQTHTHTRTHMHKQPLMIKPKPIFSLYTRHRAQQTVNIS